jgi:hypothetical protein
VAVELARIQEEADLAQRAAAARSLVVLEDMIVGNLDALERADLA